jgi:hypothetical protein
MSPRVRRLSRRAFLAVSAVGGGLGLAWALRRKVTARLSRWTQLEEFSATPPLVPHDPSRDRAILHVAKGAAPQANLDDAIAKFGGLGKVVGPDDVVLVKVSAQWWNQGMTNVAAARRLVEHVLEVKGFRGEVIVFENTHFRLADGTGLSRAWTRPSERNVDVPGFTCLGDLVPYFAERKAPVSFVGLVDAGGSELSDGEWHDPGRRHGIYGGDGRGPLAPGAVTAGYVWDFDNVFAKRKSLVETVRSPLTWPLFVSPHSGLFVDFKEGIFRIENGQRVPSGRKLTFINMTTANEHASTGITAACKSAMGIVDMSAGRLGTHPLASGYSSVHYFGNPEATWRMAGPLAEFAKRVRAPDLYVTVAEWTASMPKGAAWKDDERDIRLDAASAFKTNTVVVGTDPVAIDTWCTRHLLMPLESPRRHLVNLDDPRSKASCFLRYFREVQGKGTLDESLIVA